MMKRIVVILMMTVLACAGTARASAAEIEVLVDKLVAKGILTPAEAQIVLDETKTDVAKQVSKGNQSTLPMWVQTIKMKGDFRLRYQYQEAKDPSPERERGRIRLRLGVDANVNEKTSIGFGIATGSTGTSADSIRSTNQSFSDTFSKKSLVLDYAYVNYLATSWLTLTGGKIKNPIWEPGDLLWDTDITPEGGAAIFYGATPWSSNMDWFVNTGVFVLDEAADISNDPMMTVLQPGMDWALTEDISLKGTLAYYDYSNVQEGALDGVPSAGPTGASCNNTKVSSKLINDYDAIMPAFELGINNPLRTWDDEFPTLFQIPYFSIFAEYIENIDVANDNKGYLLGFKLGAKKLANRGDWAFKYSYRMLEKDAVPDVFPDSDFFGGRTHVRGHESLLEYALSKNTSLAVDYYFAQAIAAEQYQNKEHLFQVDLNFKF